MESSIQVASYRPFMTWGPETSNNALKRFVPSFSQLKVNSTVANVTLPYFAIQDIQWVDKTNDTLPVINLEDICPRLIMGNLACPAYYFTHGFIALIPDTPWKNQTSTSPSMITERLLMMYADPGIQDSDFCVDYTWCYAKLAWVTYSTGAAICHNCRVSSYATVQNDTELVPQEAYMTVEALRLMPYIIEQMIVNAERNATLPSWNSTDEYVVGILTRSYASAWMVLSEQMTNGPTHTNYSVSPRATRALVNFLRVYIWLALQFLVTVSGILFLYIQSQSSSRPVVNTGLAAFHLDSSALHDGAYNQFWGGAVRKVELNGNYLMVKVE